NGGPVDAAAPECAKKRQHRQEETGQKQLVSLGSLCVRPAQQRQRSLAPFGAQKMREDEVDSVAVRIELLRLGIKTAIRLIVQKLGPQPARSALALRTVAVDMVRVLVRNEEIELDLEKQALQGVRVAVRWEAQQLAEAPRPA